MRLLLLAGRSRFATCPPVCFAGCLAVGYLLAARDRADGGEYPPHQGHTLSSQIEPQDLELEFAFTNLFNQKSPSKSARDPEGKPLMWGAGKTRQDAKTRFQFSTPSRLASQEPASDSRMVDRVRNQETGQEPSEESPKRPGPLELEGPILNLPVSVAKAPTRQSSSLKSQASPWTQAAQSASPGQGEAEDPAPAGDRSVASRQGSERPEGEPSGRPGTVSSRTSNQAANQGVPGEGIRRGATNLLGKALSRPASKGAVRRTETGKDHATRQDRASGLPPLTRQQKQLRDKIRRMLSHYYNRPMNVRDRSPWEVMHMVLAFEVHSRVLQGGPRGEPITAVGWLCFNQPCKRRTLMYVNRDGQARVRVGPALQGHHGQLLAILAQSGVKKEYPVRIDDQELTVADLIEMEKETCYPNTELTFKLISLMHYLPSDATWVNDQGMEWDIPRVIREELRQPVRGAACGGTHRLAGLTLAYKKRQKRREPVNGDYLKAQRFVRKYQRYAYRLQNSDGSFSTEWFRGRGAKQDVERRMKTTGHTLEWLLYAATEKELRSRKTTRAVNYLANLMVTNRQRDWDAGQLSHGIHALLLYDRMAFGKYDQWKSAPIARKRSRTRG